MCWRTARPFAADVDKQQSDSVLCHFRFGADAAVNSEASSRSVGEHNVGMARARELSESCPADAECDTDGDGVCEGPCAGGLLLDADADSICDDDDSCVGDADNDADSDGVCDGSDLCRGDADNDADGDGVLHVAWRVRHGGVVPV